MGRKKLLGKIFKNNAEAKPKYYSNAIEIIKDVNASGTARRIKIVPIGVFPAHPDGPHEITPLHIAQMVNNLKTGGTDLLYDFGHESLWNMGAEAAGWSVKETATGEADGLYIDEPVFTDDGQVKINGKAFRYFSPVYSLENFDKNGKEMGAVLWSVGLVNTPYMDTEIDAVGNSKLKIDAIGNSKLKKLNGESEMNKKLLGFLGLPETATEAEVEVKLNSLRTEYKLAADADITAIIIAKAKEDVIVNATKKCANCGGTMKKNGAVYECADCGATIPVEKKNSKTPLSQEEIDALVNSNTAFKTEKENRVKADAEALVNSAVTDGKILPAVKDQFIADALKNFDAVKADLDKRVKNSALPTNLDIDKKGKVDLKDPHAIKNAADIYIKEQAKLGIKVSGREATNHVWKTNGGS